MSTNGFREMVSRSPWGDIVLVSLLFNAMAGVAYGGVVGTIAAALAVVGALKLGEITERYNKNEVSNVE